MRLKSYPENVAGWPNKQQKGREKMTKTVKTKTLILIILGVFILAACDLFNEDSNSEDTKAPIPAVILRTVKSS